MRLEANRRAPEVLRATNLSEAIDNETIDRYKFDRQTIAVLQQLVIFCLLRLRY